MSQYKLFYFPFPGRGELIRFIFAQAGVEYEDYRIPYEKWVGEIKPGIAKPSAYTSFPGFFTREAECSSWESNLLLLTSNYMISV